MTGSTTTPGQIALVARSTAFMTSGERGDGGEMPRALRSSVHAHLVSATTRTSVSRTPCRRLVGESRHWIVARARCGSAFSAWPASSMVATQVFRIAELYSGRRREALERRGVGLAGAVTARRSAASWPPSWSAMRVKKLRVDSLSRIGNRNAATRSSARASV